MIIVLSWKTLTTSADPGPLVGINGSLIKPFEQGLIPPCTSQTCYVKWFWCWFEVFSYFSLFIIFVSSLESYDDVTYVSRTYIFQQSNTETVVRHHVLSLGGYTHHKMLGPEQFRVDEVGLIYIEVAMHQWWINEQDKLDYFYFYLSSSY